MSIMRLSLSYWGNFPRDWHAEPYFGLVYNENSFFVFVIFLKYCHSFDKENIFLIFSEGILVQECRKQIGKGSVCWFTLTLSKVRKFELKCIGKSFLFLSGPWVFLSLHPHSSLFFWFGADCLLLYTQLSN